MKLLCPMQRAKKVILNVHHYSSPVTILDKLYFMLVTTLLRFNFTEMIFSVWKAADQYANGFSELKPQPWGWRMVTGGFGSAFFGNGIHIHCIPNYPHIFAHTCYCPPVKSKLHWSLYFLLCNFYGDHPYNSMKMYTSNLSTTT